MSRFQITQSIVKQILSLLLVLFLQLYLKSQTIYLKHFTVDDGLPSNQVYQVTETGNGKLLIATDRGGAKYDGYSFEPLVFQHNETAVPLYYIYRASPHIIYFSGPKGHIYQYENDKLIPFPYNEKISLQHQHAGLLIANTLSKKNDSLRISFNNDYSFNIQIGSSLVLPSGIIRRIDKQEGFHFDLINHFYFRQLKNSNLQNILQKVFITWEDGSTTTDSLKVSWTGGYVRRLFYEEKDSLHFFSVGRYLLVYKNKRKIAEYYFRNNVLSFFVDRLDQIYVSFENAGAVKYYFKNNRLYETQEKILQGFSVTSIYKDKQGGFWYATLDNGLFYAYPSKAILYENKTIISSIRNRGHNIYVGYQSGMIEIYKNKMLKERKHVPLLHSEILLRLGFQTSGEIIVSTNRGFYVEKQGNWNFLASPDLSLLFANEGLVFGADRNFPELHIYQGLGQPIRKTVLLPKRIIATFLDTTDHLWLGTWEGLYKYKNGKLISLTDRHKVFKDRIVGIDKLSMGWLVVASLGEGLLISKGNREIHLNSTNGLNSPIINALHMDRDTIYLGTNKGITKIFLKEDSPIIMHYGKEAGLPTLDIQQFAVLNASIYVKWLNKLVVMPLPKNEVDLPDLHLNAIFVNGKLVNHKQQHHFQYSENTFAFHFNSVNLSGAKEQVYVIKLEGVDKFWHQTKERSINYTNLRPGNYLFNIQVMGRNGTKTGVLYYNFIIKPAFWQQSWFPWLLAALVLLVLLFVIRIRFTALQRKNNLEIQLAESNQRALVQMINPHFMSNLLNTVHSAILKQNKIEAASIMAKFAKLMRMTMELGKDKYVLLEKEITLLKEYLSLESVRAPDKFNFSISVTKGVKINKTYIPGMLIQPFVENAIKHGIMHLDNKKGHVKLEIFWLNQQLICRISDNGIGRLKSSKINSFKQTDHYSSGINITINRLKLLHKMLNTPYYFLFSDLYDDVEEPGTLVTFSIPYKFHI